MTIYRIHPDRMHYQLMTISSEEIISKLGKQNPFHIDPTPRPYTHIWKPLEISFYDSTTGKNKAKQPDITLDHGRLFLNNAGCDALSKLIETDGELLPVFFEGQSGAIFNTLKCAEDLNALDTKRSTKNDWGDLQSLVFVEENLNVVVLFRCKFDTAICASRVAILTCSSFSFSSCAASCLRNNSFSFCKAAVLFMTTIIKN